MDPIAYTTPAYAAAPMTMELKEFLASHGGPGCLSFERYQLITDRLRCLQYLILFEPASAMSTFYLSSNMYGYGLSTSDYTDLFWAAATPGTATYGTPSNVRLMELLVEKGANIYMPHSNMFVEFLKRDTSQMAFELEFWVRHLHDFFFSCGPTITHYMLYLIDMKQLGRLNMLLSYGIQLDSTSREARNYWHHHGFNWREGRVEVLKKMSALLAAGFGPNRVSNQVVGRSCLICMSIQEDDLEQCLQEHATFGEKMSYNYLQFVLTASYLEPSWFRFLLSRNGLLLTKDTIIEASHKKWFMTLATAVYFYVRRGIQPNFPTEGELWVNTVDPAEDSPFLKFLRELIQLYCPKCPPSYLTWLYSPSAHKPASAVPSLFVLTCRKVRSTYFVPATGVILTPENLLEVVAEDVEGELVAVPGLELQIGRRMKRQLEDHLKLLLVDYRSALCRAFSDRLPQFEEEFAAYFSRF